MKVFGFGKRGVIGDIIEVLPTFVLITFIAVGFFALAADSYAYDISVRDSEARILARGMGNCLSGEGVLDLDGIGSDNFENIAYYCGFDLGERAYVGIDVYDADGKRVEVLSEGDSGALWVRDLFDGVVSTGEVISGRTFESVEKISEYKPGYFNFEYPVFVIWDGVKFKGKVNVEVLIKNE